MMKGYVNSIPLGRVGTSEDVAKVIAFLASDAAGYLVGETIEVNGGMYMD
jgi:NAD(P)-dependent dehydrogenase (short-subunit alcohol dehydrogenase family)